MQVYVAGMNEKVQRITRGDLREFLIVIRILSSRDDKRIPEKSAEVIVVPPVGG